MAPQLTWGLTDKCTCLKGSYIIPVYIPGQWWGLTLVFMPFVSGGSSVWASPSSFTSCTASLVRSWNGPISNKWEGILANHLASMMSLRHSKVISPHYKPTTLKSRGFSSRKWQSIFGGASSVFPFSSSHPNAGGGERRRWPSGCWRWWCDHSTCHCHAMQQQQLKILVVSSVLSSFHHYSPPQQSVWK